MPRARLFPAALLALGAILPAGSSRAQSLVVALGDSNAAGYGVGPGQAFPAQLEALLRARGRDVQVYNAGVSGDTTGGMLARLDAAAPPGTRLVIVQGGFNDRARGSPPGTIVANLQNILARLNARGIGSVLCGFFDPGLDAAAAAVARSYGSVHVPVGACYDPAYRGPDGLHMSAAGHRVVAARLLPVVNGLLGSARRRRGA